MRRGWTLPCLETRRSRHAGRIEDVGANGPAACVRRGHECGNSVPLSEVYLGCAIGKKPCQQRMVTIANGID